MKPLAFLCAALFSLAACGDDAPDRPDDAAVSDAAATEDAALADAMPADAGMPDAN